MMTLTYDRTWAEEQLTGRCKDRRKIANNTYLERRGDDIAVRLHDTDIVTYKANGDVVLDSGGWRTATTKERMHTYAPVRWVRQQKGVWFVAMPGEEREYRYDDGFTIHADGTVSGFVPDQKAANDDKRARDVKRRINEFVDSIRPEEIVRALENTQGDCLYCQLGLPDGDHLDEHLRHRYVQGSMMFHAVKERGYRDPSVILSMAYHDAQRGQVSRMLTDDLKKYLRRHLLPGRATR